MFDSAQAAAVPTAPVATSAITTVSPDCVARPPRWQCHADVTIADDCGRELIGRIANLSEGGFMAECEEKVPLHAIVSVDLPDRGLVRAEVRWVLGWRFGARIIAD